MEFHYLWIIHELLTILVNSLIIIKIHYVDEKFEFLDMAVISSKDKNTTYSSLVRQPTEHRPDNFA